MSPQLWILPWVSTSPEDVSCEIIKYCYSPTLLQMEHVRPESHRSWTSVSTNDWSHAMDLCGFTFLPAVLRDLFVEKTSLSPSFCSSSYFAFRVSSTTEEKHCRKHHQKERWTKKQLKSFVRCVHCDEGISWRQLVNYPTAVVNSFFSSCRGAGSSAPACLWFCR